MAMKKFHIELTGFIEMDTDQERDARILTERVLEKIRSVFSEHGAILDCNIDIGSITEKPLTKKVPVGDSIPEPIQREPQNQSNSCRRRNSRTFRDSTHPWSSCRM